LGASLGGTSGGDVGEERKKLLKLGEKGGGRLCGKGVHKKQGGQWWGGSGFRGKGKEMKEGIVGSLDLGTGDIMVGSGHSQRCGLLL